MAGLNKVMLIGHLGKDPEMRYTASGLAIANISLATTERVKGEDRTEWHRIVAWGRLAETCGQYLGKGRQVHIEGRIQTRDWEDKDGNRRTTTEIVAYDLIMLGGRDSGEGRGRDDGYSGSGGYGRGGRSEGRERSGGYDEGRRGEGGGQRDRRDSDPGRESDRGRGSGADRPSEPPPPEDEIPF